MPSPLCSLVHVRVHVRVRACVCVCVCACVCVCVCRGGAQPVRHGRGCRAHHPFSPAVRLRRARLHQLPRAALGCAPLRQMRAHAGPATPHCLAASQPTTPPLPSPPPFLLLNCVRVASLFAGYLGFEADNSLHLLTPAFFTDLHRVITPGGHLTIFSDNGRYCRALAGAFGKLRAANSGRALLFASVDVHSSADSGGEPTFERIGEVKLYYGVPGAECGHLQTESSYFDRLWEYRQGEATERFFMHLRRD